MLQDVITRATPAAGMARQPRRPLTPRQRRNRRWLLCGAAVVLLPLCALIHTLWLGNNRWRVWFHHGVPPPASARQFQCSGATALSYWIGNHSHARFRIDPADLPQFLRQFPQPVFTTSRDGGTRITGKPWSLPITPDGEAGGPSPTGTDYYGLRWRTTTDGVLVDIDTDWN